MLDFFPMNGKKEYLALIYIATMLLLSHFFVVRESSKVLTISHEAVHAVIYRYYNCTDIKVEVKCGLLSCKGITYAACNKDFQKEMELLHSLNEIFGYQFSVLKDIILLAAFEQLIVSIAILLVISSILERVNYKK